MSAQDLMGNLSAVAAGNMEKKDSVRPCLPGSEEKEM